MKKLILSAMLLLTCLIFAEKIQVTNGSNSVNVVSSNEFETILDYNVADFNRENIEIQGEVFDQLNFDLGGNTFELGSPALPKSSESIIIGADSNVDFEIISQDYVEYNMNVAPSKGFGSRQIDPATVPFQFNSNYENNDFYPQNIVSLGSPYIMRDYRGVVVNVTPFQYNHQTNTLRVYTNVRVAIRENGTSNENISRRTPKNNGYFSSLYKGHFLNFPETRYDAVEETGRMIVIAADEFADAVQPYVDWKNKKGIQTDLYLKSVAGNTAVEIKSFIQGQFDQNDGLTFVQLVGDNAQIPTFSSGGGGSDPKYALLAGGDGYPDIFVGRFSAETVAHVNTQVQRTITYERDILDGDWMQKAAGVASSEGAGSGDDGEADWQHQDVIRNKLLDYGYSEVDQLYANNGVNSQAVANSLNEGRGLFNYTGHGSTTTWVTSGFSNNDINQLTNDNMLPFINSVACVNGNFTGSTCFAEAWMRATNNTTGEPTGAIAIYASTINQSWLPPMQAQDEFVDLLVEEQKNTTGGLFYNSSLQMLDESGADDMYETWHIFGDVSLQVRTKTPEAIALGDLTPLFIGFSEYTVTTDAPGALVSLTNENNEIISSVFADDSGNATLTFESFNAPTDLTLTITGYNKITTVQTLSVLPAGGAYVVATNPQIDGSAFNGETVNLTLSIKNVGDQDASGIETTLSSTSQEVSITNSDVVVGDLAANETASSDEFTFEISNNVINGTELEFVVTSTDGTDTWTSNFTLEALAPELEIFEISVEDANNQLDANETVTINAIIRNNGQNIASDLAMSMMSQSSDITINTAEVTSQELVIDGIFEASFEVQVGDVEEGTLINFVALANASGYSSAYAIMLPVGQVTESFETGDLSAFSWVNENPGWDVVSSGAQDGTYCVQSTNINDNEEATIKISSTLGTDSEISFFRKVSSESGYDKLKFYINGSELGSWDGNVAWDEVTYPVTAGPVEFKWVYSKDSMVSTGSDCAWIDNITFPAMAASGSAEVISNINTIDFGNVELDTDSETRVVSLYNLTSNIVTGTVTIPEGFEVNGESNGLVFEIETGENQAFNVTFCPTEEITTTGSLVFTPNIGDPISVSLAGVGVSTSAEVNTLTALKGNYPNPFNPTTTIRFSNKNTGNVKINIYNARGQKVKTLVNDIYKAGNHKIEWKGTDDSNQSVSSGIYFYKMRSGKYTSTKKMVLLK